MLTEQKTPVFSPCDSFQGSWIEFATDINNVMYVTSTGKKFVTTLLRAIGYQTDKEILEIFGLADEFKVTKSGIKNALNRKLAAGVLKTWVEDFVDEDTSGKWFLSNVMK